MSGFGPAGSVGPVVAAPAEQAGGSATHGPKLRRVALVNLGCRVNRVELDDMATRLEAVGFSLATEDQAAAVVINTCAVTGEAEAKARKAVHHAASLPQAPLVVATGCAACLFAQELEALGPNVVVERDKGRVPELVAARLGVAAGPAGVAATVPAAGGTPTPTGRTRPGVKVQDGCDNRCTYCIVWKARGAARSVPLDECVRLVQGACDRGAREVVLTGINLGSWRGEKDGRSLGLPGLIDELLATTSVGRLRLSSIEPPDVDAELAECMARAGERVAPFLHICLQAGCDATLGRMGRVYDTAAFRAACQAVRSAVPNVALGTDIICGFPGETDEDFDRSLDFCREMGFSRMHVFRYSKRPGTPAATAPDQVDPRVMAERARRARELARAMRAEEAARLVGQGDLVVVQYPHRGVTGGLFDVALDRDVPLGSLVRVRVTGADAQGTLVATVLDATGPDAFVLPGA